MTLSKRELDYGLIVILLCGISVFALKCRLVSQIDSVGGTDSASHAEMAESLTQGKGFSEDFIQYSHFFSPLRYSDVTHPAADYHPLYSLLVAPCCLLFGKSAFGAKIPAMLIGSLVLPVLLYLLTARVSGNKFTGLAAAFGAIAFPEFFQSSLRCDDDLLFALLVLASCFFIMKAENSPKYFFTAGILIALTFYAKGSGLLLIPIYL